MKRRGWAVGLYGLNSVLFPVQPCTSGTLLLNSRPPSPTHSLSWRLPGHGMAVVQSGQKTCSPVQQTMLVAAAISALYSSNLPGGPGGLTHKTKRERSRAAAAARAGTGRNQSFLDGWSSGAAGGMSYAKE